jgi:hypothetical protein
LAGISHLDSGPRPAWAFFLILFLLHRFASPFSSPPIVFPLAVAAIGLAVGAGLFLAAFIAKVREIPGVREVSFAASEDH